MYVKNFLNLHTGTCIGTCTTQIKSSNLTKTILPMKQFVELFSEKWLPQQFRKIYHLFLEDLSWSLPAKCSALLVIFFTATATVVDCLVTNCRVADCLVSYCPVGDCPVTNHRVGDCPVSYCLLSSGRLSSGLTSRWPIVWWAIV